MQSKNRKSRAASVPQKKKQPHPAQRLRGRKTPERPRGRAAVERILEATGKLLEEFGYDGVTTIRIAERAGVNIATLYRYYPNKYAVLADLAKRHDGERADATARVLREMPFAQDWRGSVAAAIDEAVRLREKQTGGRALRHALQSSPELWQIDHETTRRVAGVLAEGMRARRPKVDAQTIRDMAIVVVATVTALLDLRNDPGVDPARIREQMTDLMERYLGPIFK